jgi:phosphate transport system substrate-binding protein
MKIFKKTTAILILTAMLALTLTSCSGGGREHIIFAGSTSVQPALQALSEAYARAQDKVMVNVQGGGSSAGITAALSNTAHVGMSSRSLRATELLDDDGNEKAQVILIGRDALALIVHPSNPNKGISTEDARMIYSGEITHWSQLNGSLDDKSGGRIHVYSREAGSGTREVFENNIMVVMKEEIDENGETKRVTDTEKTRSISNKTMIQSTNGTIMALVGGDPNAIGYISLGLIPAEEERQTVRALALDDVEANVENVRDGHYKFYRPFLLVLNPDTTRLEATDDFLDYIFTDEGADILREQGLVPESDNWRTQLGISEGTGD